MDEPPRPRHAAARESDRDERARRQLAQRRPARHHTHADAGAHEVFQRFEVVDLDRDAREDALVEEKGERPHGDRALAVVEDERLMLEVARRHAAAVDPRMPRRHDRDELVRADVRDAEAIALDRQRQEGDVDVPGVETRERHRRMSADDAYVDFRQAALQLREHRREEIVRRRLGRPDADDAGLAVAVLPEHALHLLDLVEHLPCALQ